MMGSGKRQRPRLDPASSNKVSISQRRTVLLCQMGKWVKKVNPLQVQSDFSSFFIFFDPITKKPASSTTPRSHLLIASSTHSTPVHYQSFLLIGSHSLSNHQPKSIDRLVAGVSKLRLSLRASDRLRVASNNRNHG